MSDCALHLTEHVLPKQASYRQWTLSLPYRCRLRVAMQPKLLSDLLSHFLRTVFAWQRRAARKLGVKKPLTGAVTFVQLWGVFYS